MPKCSTLPTLYDEMRSFSMSTLKRLNLFAADEYRSGQLIWSRRGEQVASINVSTSPEHRVMRLWYHSNGEPVDYQIRLEALPSNLGTGKVWYFICPVTGKRCQKLFGGKYFLHREAYPHAMYEKQTYSRYGRYLDKVFSTYHSYEKLYSELNSKYFKTHYAGKPTKRYQRILSGLEHAQRMDNEYLKVMESI